MLFNAPIFFIFLAITIGVFCLIPASSRKPWILLTSYFFYGYWDWRFLSLLIISSIVDWAMANAIERHREDAPTSKRLILVSLVVNLGVLGFFKYFNFFIESMHSALASLGVQASLPALLNFSLYVAFFPQLVAGPIERAGHLLPQVVNMAPPSGTFIRRGFALLLLGYIQKVAISDNVAGAVDGVFAMDPNAGWIPQVAGIILFSVQIYLDFAGYSNIARGTALLFGVELMQNFRQPYFSRNLAEFWRRWHISLSFWLRDYLYFPLGGNRCGAGRAATNLLIVMLLGGLWHGANWTFVVWGAYHGIFLALLRLMPRNRTAPTASIIRPIFGALVTYIVVAIGWLLFRSPTLADASRRILSLFTAPSGVFDPALWVQVTMACGSMFTLDVLSARYGTDEFFLKLPRLLTLMVAIIAIVVIALTMLSHLSKERPFIYFQF
jgi:D-alanyl-lipoteichoic acid acyltransferase DltB (MBOAT superfamily)